MQRLTTNGAVVPLALDSPDRKSTQVPARAPLDNLERWIDMRPESID